MKILPTALAAHMAGGGTSTAIALKITRADGVVMGWTSASISETIGGVTYDATQGLLATNIDQSAGFGVDNLELVTLDDGSLFTATDILGGVWRDAKFLMLRYNWRSPSDGVEPIIAGTVGNVTLRNGSVVAELRGLQQYLQQPIGNVSTKTCRARVGDYPKPAGNNRCRLDAAAYQSNLEVLAVTSRSEFVVGQTGATPGDPFWSSVKLLVHCNGGGGSNILPDSSPAARTLTAAGNAQISTAVTRFGSGTLYLDGVGDYVTVPDSTDWAFGTSEWTIEMEVRPADDGTTRSLIGKAIGTGFYPFNIRRENTTRLTVYLTNGSSVQTINGDENSAIAIGQWSHVALSRSGDTARLFVRGVLCGSVTMPTGFSLMTNNAPLCIGNFSADYAAGAGASAGFYGHLDEIRISNFARYTATFTPPSEAHLDAPVGGSGAPPSDWFGNGLLTFTSGANAGLSCRVLTYSATGALKLAAPLVMDVEVGDLLLGMAGCRGRLEEDCRDKFDNAPNFQGEPHRPPLDSLTSSPVPSV